MEKINKKQNIELICNSLHGTQNFYTVFLVSSTLLINNCGGNIDDNPDFDSSSASGLELLDVSPCIDAGNNKFVHGAGDIASNKRKVSVVDVGAFEYKEITIIPGGDEVHFSGILIGDGCYLGDGPSSIAFEEDEISVFLKPGSYPDVWYPLGNANCNSLDGIALHEGTRVLNITGPAII